jgi:hypothetical protein
MEIITIWYAHRRNSFALYKSSKFEFIKLNQTSSAWRLRLNAASGPIYTVDNIAHSPYNFRFRIADFILILKLQLDRSSASFRALREQINIFARAKTEGGQVATGPLTSAPAWAPPPHGSS